ncbi:unnamed protein product [Lactuca saligna]|uniref:Uncharacterized protein n=1 Tax=Lactuca saligna TaxID=75948 RepID=A0AA36EMV5_LACSI|nr:unnamed protein product [Lactuca saligna]
MQNIGKCQLLEQTLASSYHTTIRGSIGSCSLYFRLMALLHTNIKMDESNEDPSAINRNKRKSQNEDLNLPVSKHTCLEKSVSPSNFQSDISHSRFNQTESAKDSNNFFEDADSVMSIYNDSENELPYLKISPYDHHSSSSVNWSGRVFDTSVNSVDRSETKSFDEASYDFYMSQNFEEEELDCGENETKQMEDEEALENFFCSNDVIPDNFVLSSGRWNVNQDGQQGTEKLTIDKEFEQYFSMLML